MIPPKYNFYIQINDGEKKSVTPHFRELSKKYAKESEQEFFRISLDGKINLFGQDYELVANASLEDKLTFTIDKYSRASDTWAEYYRGEFNKTDCKLDYSRKRCELKMTAVDSYTDIMNNYDNTYDLIKLAPEITKINMHKRSLMQVYVRGANSISNFFGGTYWEADVNEAVDSDTDLKNKYYFAYIKAGNEFYISGASPSTINGVYAGTNGSWAQWNGYTAELVVEIFATDPAPSDVPTVYDISSTASRKARTSGGEADPGGTYIENLYRLQITQNSSSNILYKSEWLFYVEAVNANNIYIDRNDIVLASVNTSNKVTITNSFVYHMYRRLLCDVDSVEDSEGVKATYDLPVDDFVTDDRNYKKCIGLSGGLFFCTSRAVSEPTKYGLNDYGQYFTDQFIPSIAGLGRPLPISRNSWANASLWYVYDDYYEYFEQKFRKQYTLKDSYSIAAAIKALLKKIAPSISHEATAEYSQFLYGATNPLGLNRFFVYITQKTNILKGNYDQPAQKAETSFKELMEMLRDCFRCYWYIEDNKLKIEHVYFFMNGGSYTRQTGYQMDFTKLKDQFNKMPALYFQSEVEYDKSELNQRYEFAWMDNVTDLFGGVTLDVKSNYVQQDKTEQITASQFSSDVDFMLFNPSSFSNDGFALLCAIEDEKYEVYSIKDNTALIALTGEVSGENNSYRLDIYQVNAGMAYKLKGITEGIITTASLFADTELEQLIKYYYTMPIGGTKTYDNIITIPQDGYLAVCVKKSIPESEQITLLSGNPSIPIIKATGLIDENGNNYDAIVQNWYASWIYLQKLYMWDMPAQTIESNTLENLYVIGIKKCLKHNIEFPSEEDLNELELVKTAIGNGKIDEMSFNLCTRQAEIDLLYKP